MPSKIFRIWPNGIRPWSNTTGEWSIPTECPISIVFPGLRKNLPIVLVRANSQGSVRFGRPLAAYNRQTKRGFQSRMAPRPPIRCPPQRKFSWGSASVCHKRRKWRAMRWRQTPLRLVLPGRNGWKWSWWHRDFRWGQAYYKRHKESRLRSRCHWACRWSILSGCPTSRKGRRGRCWSLWKSMCPGWLSATISMGIADRGKTRDKNIMAARTMIHAKRKIYQLLPTRCLPVFLCFAFLRLVVSSWKWFQWTNIQKRRCL